MTDTTTPDDSGSTEPEARTLADWMRITQRAFMRRVAEQVETEGIDLRAAMAAKFHGHGGPDADELTAAVKAVQEQATASVPADDLAATLRTIEAIARKLGWDESQASGPGLGFGHGRGFGPGFGRGGWPGPWRGFDARAGYGHGHGHECGPDGHHRGHGGHPRGHGDHPKRERAYERGFDAGFDAARRRLA